MRGRFRTKRFCTEIGVCVFMTYHFPIESSALTLGDPHQKLIHPAVSNTKTTIPPQVPPICVRRERADNIILKERKLNIAPAIKKQ
eukprot:TCALIF_07043-PA protein Name:"Protein of unknown function" AED:0.86 eAED:0.86 QI:0/0/0.5/0.5/0/0.5/2/0/85